MSSALKSKRLLKLASLIAISLVVVALLYLIIRGKAYAGYDFRLLDRYYRLAVKYGYGPRPAVFPQVKYVTITDETYSYTNKNYLDRSFLSHVNDALFELGVEAVAYDIIFPRPTSPASDQAFAESIRNIDCAYLPIGLRTSKSPEKFAWKPGNAYAKLQQLLKKPLQKGSPEPFHGIDAMVQHSDFAEAAHNSGHISSFIDEDGTSRHMMMLIKVEDQFFPALALSLFLDYAGVPFEKILVEWGKQITIPATEESFLEEEVIIPIDERGLAFIPYCSTWENGFDELPSHVLLEKMKDTDLRGNLAEIFEGNLIFIGDISIGISDLGNTPLQNDVPLIVVHASMLNGMLTNTFYKKWSYQNILGLILAIGIVLGCSSLFRSSSLLYGSASVLIIGILLFTGHQFVHFTLFPVATVGGATIFIASGLIISLEVLISRDRNYIRNIFARYVPEKVVSRFLGNPHLLNLGGETREISLMMTDLRGFTAMASERHPEEVIKILNRYFDTMVEIIHDHRGIIDEIIGDGILAFFGAPEIFEDHPEKAVACALSMQKAMTRINTNNEADGLPRLEMGIAVNTGEVVVGNIGSLKRTKYGAVGSQVNFTGRAESYTVGGQVLVSDATYQRLENIVRIDKVLKVSMKGMTEKVNLYDVIGLEGEYDLFLERKDEKLCPTKNKIAVRLFQLSEKIVEDTCIEGFITHLSSTKGKIMVPRTLAELENIRLNITNPELHTGGAEFEDHPCEVYAKVMSSRKSGSEFETLVSFTSVSSHARAVFKAETA